jgi:hypothetical protein
MPDDTVKGIMRTILLLVLVVAACARDSRNRAARGVEDVDPTVHCDDWSRGAGSAFDKSYCEVTGFLFRCTAAGDDKPVCRIVADLRTIDDPPKRDPSPAKPEPKPAEASDPPPPPTKAKTP